MFFRRFFGHGLSAPVQGACIVYSMHILSIVPGWYVSRSGWVCTDFSGRSLIKDLESAPAPVVWYDTKGRPVYSFRRIVVSVSVLLLLIVTGTAGYMLIEGWPLLDSLYMTITTMATVGFGEVHPLSNAARVFTLLLIVTGVSVFFTWWAAWPSLCLKVRFNGSSGEKRWKRRSMH